MLMKKSREIRLEGEKLILREKRLSDADEDYVWATDGELMRLDASAPIQTPYSAFLWNFAEEMLHRDKHRNKLAIETLDGKHIGNCSYYNVARRRRETEVGILIGDKDYWGLGYGEDALKTLVKHIFDEVGLERIFLHTLSSNLRAQKCFQKCGFITCKQTIRGGLSFLCMELFRS